jgi:hypothetical protein
MVYPCIHRMVLKTNLSKMDIYLTFDYELYFGEPTGSIEKCIIEPTEALLKVADAFDVKLVQFVDCGYLKKIQEEKIKHPSLEKDFKLLAKQLEIMNFNQHDLQLHIHPHWEDSFYVNNKWVCNVNRYKLTCFSNSEINTIVTEYKKALAVYNDTNNIIAYRAGGWCLQPFENIGEALKKNNIKVDSSVFRGGYFESEQYNYDFRNAPKKSRYKFEVDPNKELEKGHFTEMPITSIINSPLFYWKLFLLGRLNPEKHKPLGDGKPIAAPGQRKKMLTRYTTNTVSLDGYNAALLEKALYQQQAIGAKEMVIIGHPKALTRYGLNALKEFILKNHKKHNFTTFIKEKNTF